MFSAFLKLGDGSHQAFDSYDELRKQQITEDDVTLWIDLEKPLEEELNEVGKVFHLDADALEDCLSGEQRPRLDEFDNYLFVVLYGMYGVGEDSSVVPRKLAAFCGSNFLITVHREPLKTLRDVRTRCSRHPKHVLGQGAAFLLYSVIDGLIDKYGVVIDEMETHLDELEEQSLHMAVEDSLLANVGRLRAKLMELRHIASAQKELLNPLAKGDYGHFSRSLEIRFRHVRDHLTLVIEQIDDMRDRLRYVVDNHRALLAQQMNSIVKVLTIFSAILLPLTFVAGVYGMNFEKSMWPPSEHPFSFGAVLVFLGATAIVLFAIFLRKKWL